MGLGSLGLSGPARVRIQATRRAVLLTTVGGALTIASIVLVTMVQARWAGELPLFGAPAAGAPIPYTPVCRFAPLPVCVHPAYRAQLGEAAALLNRIAVPVLGLPGAPTRAVQRPGTVGVVAGGAQPVLAFAPIDFHDPTNPPGLVASWVGQVAVSLVADNTSLTTQFWTPDKAQNAVALYLLHQAGVQYNLRQFDESPDVLATERRFAALTPRARHTWLRAHYTLLRQGRVRLEEIP